MKISDISMGQVELQHLLSLSILQESSKSIQIPSAPAWQQCASVTLAQAPCMATDSGLRNSSCAWVGTVGTVGRVGDQCQT